MPILGFGGIHILDKDGCTEKEAVKMLEYALDKGIRYFDTAHWYGDGESERRYGLAAKRRRKEMWIATKTMERTRQEARKELEESLKRLQTDYVDEWRMHWVYSFEELDKITARGGALEAAVKAKAEGLVRFISISNHTDPQVQVKALEMFPFDSILFPASVLDRFALSFVDELLPVMKAKGVASTGMKLLADGKLGRMYEKALRFAFSQPLDAFVVGMKSMTELKKNLEIAETYLPLDDAEKLAFYRRVMPLVRPQNMPWKADDWDNPTGWLKR
jgi:aryl-alcohol dehydrogenase-like predicted oxidoreductase